MHIGDTFICAMCKRETVATGQTQSYCKDCARERHIEQVRDYVSDAEAKKLRREVAHRRENVGNRMQSLFKAVGAAKENRQTYGQFFAPVVTVYVPEEYRG